MTALRAPTSSAARPRAKTAPRRAPHRSSVAAAAAAARRPSVAAAAAAAAATTTPSPRRYDVLGVGQALVDMQFTVEDDALLENLGVAKGGRRVVSPRERERVLALLSALGSGSGSGNGNGGNGGGGLVSAGGSLSNTLIGLSRLGRAAGDPLSVAMGGSVGGDDALGALAQRELRRAGVQQVATPPSSSSCSSSSSSSSSSSQETGTVIVLTTKSDAQRSFLACFPPDTSMARDNALAAEAEAAAAAAAATATTTTPLREAAQATHLLALEGYVLELPGAAEALPALAALARQSGARVALAAGDAGVVRRHRAAVAALLLGGGGGGGGRGGVRGGVDIVLANAEEAEELAAIVREELQEEEEEQQAPPSSAPSPAASKNKKAGGGATPPPEAAARCLAAALGGRALVSVTDGSRGAYLAAAGGELAVVPPCWSREAPVDTTGAGDAFSAGLLWSLLSQQRRAERAGADEQEGGGAGLDLHALGAAARRAAAAVIARVGPALTEEDAAAVVAAAAAGGPAPLPPLPLLRSRRLDATVPARR